MGIVPHSSGGAVGTSASFLEVDQSSWAAIDDDDSKSLNEKQKKKRAEKQRLKRNIIWITEHGTRNKALDIPSYSFLTCGPDLPKVHSKPSRPTKNDTIVIEETTPFRNLAALTYLLLLSPPPPLLLLCAALWSATTLSFLLFLFSLSTNDQSINQSINQSIKQTSLSPSAVTP